MILVAFALWVGLTCLLTEIVEQLLRTRERRWRRLIRHEWRLPPRTP